MGVERKTAMTLTGYEAIAYAQKYGIDELSCAANQMDDGGFVSLKQAGKIAQEDPCLLSLTLLEGPDSDEYAEIIDAADEIRRNGVSA
jgi:hypothetical protein